MAQFSPKDFRITLAAALLVSSGTAGVMAIPTGQSMLLSAVTNLDFDPGGEADYMPGQGVKALAVLIKTAKGKLDIDLSNAVEGWAARELVGGIGSTCILTVVAVRSGMIPVSFVFAPATFKNGGGLKMSDVSDKLSLLFTDCLQDGQSIYNEAA